MKAMDYPGVFGSLETIGAADLANIRSIACKRGGRSATVRELRCLARMLDQIADEVLADIARFDSAGREHPAAKCGAKTEIDNGETVSPCHKLAGHTGEHEGYCLGSRARWTDD